MKQTNRLSAAIIYSLVSVFVVAAWFVARPASAQQQTGTYDDGTLYITAFVDVDSNYNLYVASYMQVEFDDCEDIDEIEVHGYADEDNGIIDSSFSDGDDDDPAAFSLQSDAPVPTGHEYGMESDGFACFDDGEGDCDFEPVGSAYASVNVANPIPQINSISPSSVDEGDQGTLTINGSNLVENSGDQLTINYSGSGMPFMLTGTPSSSTASFSYDFTGYSPGTYNISVTNNEGTSNSETFTVNSPQNTCSQSTVPNSVTLQISGLDNQSGTFTLSHATATAANATTTVVYGPFSTPSSVASSIASSIVRNYAYLGLTAQSNGPAITLQSWSAFGTLSSSSSNVNIGEPSSVSCVAQPSVPALPCTGLFPDYGTPRFYRTDGITETPQQHIIRKHISGVPSSGVPPNTVYINNKPTPAEMFILVQGYNFTTVFLQWIPKNGFFSHTFKKVITQTPTGTVEKGFIGVDVAGNDLYTNLLRLTPNRCTAITSYPTK